MSPVLRHQRLGLEEGEGDPSPGFVLQAERRPVTGAVSVVPCAWGEHLTRSRSEGRGRDGRLGARLKRRSVEPVYITAVPAGSSLPCKTLNALGGPKPARALAGPPKHRLL